MKRIIARISLVALIATAVAPVAQAHWITDGLKNFGNSAQRNPHITIPCVASILAGIAALAYEYKHKKTRQSPWKQSAWKEYETNLDQYNKQRKELGNQLEALRRIKSREFKAIDLDVLGTERQDFIRGLNDVRTQSDDLINAFLHNFVSPLITAKQDEFNKLQKPKKPLALDLIVTGKVIGLIGGAVASAALLKQMVNAYRMGK